MARKMWILLLGILLTCIGLAQTATSVIQPGDRIKLVCDEEPSISREYRVTEKGQILVDFLGAVKVAGMTREEAAKMIANRLVSEKILAKATVRVDQGSASGGATGPVVRWSGEVESEGSIAYREGLTLADVWPLIKPKAGADLASLTITGQDGRSQTVNANSGTDLRAIVLRSGDRITVNARAAVIGKVQVSGEVNAPGSYDITNQSNLAELIAKAGGFTVMADQERIGVNRLNSAPFALRMSADASFRPNAGDQITILKKAAPLTVPIVGMIRKPGLYELPTGTKLTVALVQAGGLTPEADRRKLRVFFPSEAKPRLVDLDAIELGYSGDVLLQPGMKVEIPDGKGKLTNTQVKYAAGAAVLLFLLGR